MVRANQLLERTRGLGHALDAKQAQNPPQTPGAPFTPKTAPGKMIVASNDALATEVRELRERLKQFAEGLPALKLDPARVEPSPWANRHQLAFTNAEFAGLRESIKVTGGNTVPILVRRRMGEPDKFEVVYGHRRHRACLDLGLSVLAVVWEGELSDVELFRLMEVENRERADPSPWEQGAAFNRALEAGLFSSVRNMAAAVGVSHTWIQKALSVWQLPAAIVETFASPLEIQHRHAEALNAAMKIDRKAVLKRAERLRQSGRQLGPQAVVAALIGRSSPDVSAPQEIKAGEQVLGAWRSDAKGRAVITVEARYSDEKTMRAVADAIIGVLNAQAQQAV